MRNRYLVAKKKQHRMSHILVTTVLVMLIAVVSFNKYRLNTKLDEYKKREAYLEQQIEAEEQRSEDIAEYAKYTKTKKFAEEIAKEKLGLVNENEIIFKTDR